MKVTTMYCILILGIPWPPVEPRLLYATTHDGQNWRIANTKNGALHLTVSDPVSLQKVEVFTQPLRIVGNRRRGITVKMVCNVDSCEMEVLRGKHQIEFPANGNGLPILQLLPLPVPVGPSYTRRERDRNCGEWIGKRRLKFGIQRAGRQNRKAKDTAGQIVDLKASIQRLRHLVREVELGAAYFLGTLAGELRASVYWEKDSALDRGYDPLLLRLASKAELPLPVYCLPNIPPPQATQEADLQVEFTDAGIEAIFPTEIIVDLQEVLSRKIVRSGHATLDGRGMISELANTMGATHYDAELSDFVELFRGIISYEQTSLQRYVCDLAKTVATLSEWVLSELSTRELSA